MDAHPGHKCTGSTSAQSAKAEDVRKKAAMLLRLKRYGIPASAVFVEHAGLP